jgi:hypothetical protein
MQLMSNQSMYSYAAPGKVETSVNWIAFKKDGDFTLIREYELNNAYFNMFQRKLAPVFNKVITNLKKQKEHLALQLNFEFGNMPEEEYNKQEEKYLVDVEDVSTQELKQAIDILFSFSNVAMDSEEISEAFNCRLDTAEEALQKFLFEDKPSAGI